MSAPLPDFPVSPVTFDMATQAAGFTMLKAEKLVALGVVGETLKKIGAVKIGRSNLLLSDEQMDETYRLCRDMVVPDQCGINDGLALSVEQRLAALVVMKDIANGRLRGATEMINSAKVDLSDSAKPAGGIPSFLPKSETIPMVTAEVILETRAEQAKLKAQNG